MRPGFPGEPVRHRTCLWAQNSTAVSARRLSSALGDIIAAKTGPPSGATRGASRDSSSVVLGRCYGSLMSMNRPNSTGQLSPPQLIGCVVKLRSLLCQSRQHLPDRDRICGLLLAEPLPDAPGRPVSLAASLRPLPTTASERLLLSLAYAPAASDLSWTVEHSSERSVRLQTHKEVHRRQAVIAPPVLRVVACNFGAAISSPDREALQCVLQWPLRGFVSLCRHSGPG